MALVGHIKLVANNKDVGTLTLLMGIESASAETINASTILLAVYFMAKAK